MARMGRPKKLIDKTQFENLCSLQCTREEICQWFDVTEKTLDKWCKDTYGTTFSLVFDKKRGTGKISLRRSQFQLAQKNATMAIWLGKQYLGQRDVQSIEISKSVDETLKEMEDYFAEKENT